MDTSFEQFVRQELHKLDGGQREVKQDIRKLEEGQREVKQDIRKLKEGQRNLEKAISSSQTQITQWVVGLFIGTVVIIVGLSSVLLTSFMLTH